MINLGPYSGKNCPNVRFQPTVIDRILEGTALLIVLVTWISIYWLYTQREGALLPAVWVMGGCSIFCFLLMGGLAYLPVRFINFPIRVTERNAPYPGDEHHSVVSAFGQCLGLVLCIRQTPAPCLVCFVGGGIYRVLYTGV